MTFWKRPRTLVLTAMILVAAWVIHTQSRDQAVAGQQAVAAWIQEAVRSAASDRGRVPAMGATDPIVADTFASWVREVQPQNVAGDAALTVVPLKQEFFGGGAPGTHEVQMAIRGSRATLTVVWDGSSAHAIAFARQP